MSFSFCNKNFTWPMWNHTFAHVHIPMGSATFVRDFKCASISQSRYRIHIGQQSKSIGYYYFTFTIRQTEMMQSKLLNAETKKKLLSAQYTLIGVHIRSMLADAIEQIYDLYAFYAMHCSVGIPLPGDNTWNVKNRIDNCLVKVSSKIGNWHFHSLSIVWLDTR